MFIYWLGGKYKYKYKIICKNEKKCNYENKHFELESSNLMVIGR